MRTQNIILITAIIIIIATIAFIYVYITGLASAWSLHQPNDSPYFITKKPVTLKNILLPVGTKITYEKSCFSGKYERKKMLNEKDITEISFKEGTTIDWGGVPITSIVKFFNPEMKGFTVYADFDRLNENNKTPFSTLWQGCNSRLSITVANTNDWSFNKKNILDIESCGVNYQRYFKEDIQQQRYLDTLYNELIKLKY